ncbi:MAG: cell division protein FtsH [Chlamydiae bacterium SM23_39]|nr:MAG: cell division protein FtsH [Chlamydiae bacterium SM23_39]
MGKDKSFNKQQKKGRPGGFLLFFLVMLLIFFSIQTFNSGNKAKVSFNHQVEHLVNLDLIDKDQSRKIAQNDKLVTFMGKFNNSLSNNSRTRFKYLELLNKNHYLATEETQLKENIALLKKRVKNTATWFLEVTGIDISGNGFSVVGTLHDTLDSSNSITIKKVNKNPLNLRDLENKFIKIKKNPNKEDIKNIFLDANTMLKLFNSSKLGIGSDKLKQKLKNLDVRLKNFEQKDQAQQIKDLDFIFSGLNSIVADLMKKENDSTLFSLRSVRNYLKELNQLNIVSSSLAKNTESLSRARNKVLNFVWFFNNKELSTRALEKQNLEKFNHWFSQAKKEWENFNFNKNLNFKVPDQERNLVLEKTFKSQEPSPNYFSYLFTILPVALVVLVLYFLFSRQMKGVGSSAMTFGKSPAKMLTKELNKITFKDVAGAEEAKEELSEIVDFLKDPHKFTILGARIPKGVLLVGPPGTGKTLVAKAVAGEADRPFFSISGSDFVEMFVGVGASRVRDLFDQGKKNAPCIIFMDEIDAVGRQRGAGIGGGHDEREQTLNQLLVEMDGFDTKEGVILMAATNRPDILDKALLRPGRFDRRVVLDLPDIKGRYEILKVHAKKIKIDQSVDLMHIARITPGASGADLENILNEAALLAARKGRSAVTSVETLEATDKVKFGKERRSLEMDENEKRSTAYHEAGHAIVAFNVEHSDPVDKVTIIPRGFSLGSTHFMPKKNRLGYWKKEVLDQLAILLGGRASEEIFLDDMSSGAQQDITQATKLARAMVCEWGMSEELGTITYDEGDSTTKYLGVTGFHEKIYSEETARKIDREVYNLIESAHKKAKEIVKKNEEKVKLISDMLIEFETLDSQDMKEILDNSWDVEQKRNRLKEKEKINLKTPPPPPSRKNIPNIQET